MGTPVILCGKTEAIGVGVIANLKPEYEGMSSAFATLIVHGNKTKIMRISQYAIV